MHEKPYRSIVKSISWRTIGTIDTMIISYFITGNFVMAASIGSIEVFTKMVIYYFHERAWNKIPLGRVKPTQNDYQI
ncbi:hypothetical protein CPU12_08215 [Malaciobacter molluscorum LMG 25693]|uniref:DUF2061 domain-containing protein n=1 Tax=Malaciobacter molluscorum LMG 25693 TaxID=870501 RepID=A0A2G1DHK5_9BACT|nr:DUF2061 domain-containing protein [Malaciobacter molluscorum]AXX93680.1 DUF2061 domain-containing protein [Malaciobacter molluscorum LMG 25693]PHO17910.1 hypothetical protein CPU12_08215 [Malaciobacter molluscorum LMG 25693]RXJ93643.1 hypothetical protein CRV00_10335 [Malaciobacter molluscorum]